MRALLLLTAAILSLAAARPIDLAETQAPTPASAPAPGLVVVRSEDLMLAPPASAASSANPAAWAALFRVSSTSVGPAPGTTLLQGSWVDPSSLPRSSSVSQEAPAVWAARVAATAARAAQPDPAPPPSHDDFRSFQLVGYYLPPGCLSSQVCGQPYGYGYGYGGYGGGYGGGGWVG